MSKMQIESPDSNGRFVASGGVVLCKFASASPARTFVNPRLREAAGTLYVSAESVVDKVFRLEKRVYQTK